MCSLGFYDCKNQAGTNQAWTYSSSTHQLTSNDPLLPGSCAAYADGSLVQACGLIAELQMGAGPAELPRAAQVWVYTNGDEMELSLNGVSLGSQAVAQFEKARSRAALRPAPPRPACPRFVSALRLRTPVQASYLVNYQPGALIATARKSQQPWATDFVATTGAPAAVRTAAAAAAKTTACETLQLTARSLCGPPRADRAVCRASRQGRCDPRRRAGRGAPGGQGRRPGRRGCARRQQSHHLRRPGRRVASGNRQRRPQRPRPRAGQQSPRVERVRQPLAQLPLARWHSDASNACACSYGRLIVRAGFTPGDMVITATADGLDSATTAVRVR